MTEALQAPDHLDEAERRIWDKLNMELQPEKLSVQDVSGGCGSMYAIDVVSKQFKGMNMLKQQRLVNKVLGEEIKGWHGVQLSTKAP
jgi:stress-induced morphogen